MQAVILLQQIHLALQDTNMNSVNRGNETKEFIVRSVEIAKKAIKNKGKENIVGIAGSM